MVFIHIHVELSTWFYSHLFFESTKFVDIWVCQKLKKIRIQRRCAGCLEQLQHLGDDSYSVVIFGNAADGKKASPAMQSRRRLFRIQAFNTIPPLHHSCAANFIIHAQHFCTWNESKLLFLDSANFFLLSLASILPIVCLSKEHKDFDRSNSTTRAPVIVLQALNKTGKPGIFIVLQVLNETGGSRVFSQRLKWYLQNFDDVWVCQKFGDVQF